MVSKAFRSTGYFIEYLALIISIISVWTIMSNQGHLNTIILPAPNSILETIVELVADGALFTNMFISVSRVVQGYLLAAVLGISLGILIGLSKHLDRVTELIIQMIKPIPPIAWIPLVILWFGIGESGKVFLIFLGGFFTILINVVDGIHQTDPKLVEVSRSMETPFWKHISLMVIPGAAPNIFTGLRTGLSSCWMCVVAAELVSSTTGLGYLIMDARQFGQTDVVIVGMLTIGIVGKIMDSLLRLAEKKTLRWI
ncbi:ABC transporter permease [Anaerovibrio lipolyticus]|uniref:ABC transporter permease n=1 Tax=Anaerovibrio lipolyticus TaxID=82374 RepID=UPI0026EC4799|nr:ABC transporter permease [Anaerovibrio lipolyticus]MBE6105998.1 ABC transporter permease [Anaerovibrio lipolyticus]